MNQAIERALAGGWIPPICHVSECHFNYGRKCYKRAAEEHRPPNYCTESCEWRSFVKKVISGEQIRFEVE